MTREEIKDLLKFIIHKCELIINNKNYTADDYVQDKVEDIAEMCHRVLDGQFGEIAENKLPSNLDEVALKTYPKMPRLSEPHGVIPADNKTHYLGDANEENRIAFKAGAEWMAVQFQKIEGDLVDWHSTSDGKEYCCGVKTDEAFEIPEAFYIRKKQ